MGDILSIHNFNLYTGRYARRALKNTPETRIGWYIYGSIHEKLPVMAIRNRERETNWPLTWRFTSSARNFEAALDVILRSLKAWQAFRPAGLEAIEQHLRGEITASANHFQSQMLKLGICNLHEAVAKCPGDALATIAVAAGRISYAKNNSENPMLGSKVMHHLFPEFFPVWDTAWIKRTALNMESITNKSLEAWLTKDVLAILQNKEHYKASIEYACYVALLMRDLHNTNWRDFRALKQAYVRYSEIPKQIFEWHFGDLAPILFEVCLLGKHNAE